MQTSCASIIRRCQHDRPERHARLTACRPRVGDGNFLLGSVVTVRLFLRNAIEALFDFAVSRVCLFLIAILVIVDVYLYFKLT